MQFAEYLIISLILFGAIILFFSAHYTKKIFDVLTDEKLKNNWKKLRFLMLVFVLGYLAVVALVILGKSELLSILSGFIFFLGALFVMIVVRAGLDSFVKLKRINQSLDDSELKYQELEQFAHYTSHDLKTPLQGISSLTAFIKDDIESGKTEHLISHIDTIQNRVEHLDNLFKGILNYSRLGKLKSTPLNLGEILEKIIEPYKKLDDVSITIKGKTPRITGDETQIVQLFENLISNAVQHNDKELKQVEISFHKTATSHEIYVEDNGIGIDPKYHQKIFDVFQRINETAAGNGIGLGLSLAKKIVEKHGGTIDVHSDGNLGTKFVVRLPK